MARKMGIYSSLRDSRSPAASRGAVILAHTPPPLHGQSMMVQLLLDALGTEKAKGVPIEFFHVDCKYSRNLRSLGAPEGRKAFLALKYVWQAIRYRLENGTTTIYYIPCPGKRAAFWRDCLVLAFLRPFFSRVIFHWHAAGLSGWLESQASSVERWLGKFLFSGHDTSIVLVPEKESEAEYFKPSHIYVVPNGVPDLCPDFDRTVLPYRLLRTQLFATEGSRETVLNLLYLSTATRAKGVFDAVDAWAELNLLASQGTGPFCSLSIVGEFPNSAEKKDFDAHLTRRQGEIASAAPGREVAVRLLGALYDDAKLKAYTDADVFVFPSTYSCESFGIVLVEAAYFGLPCVTYQPLIGPEGLSPAYHRRVPSGNVHELALGILEASQSPGNASAIREDAIEKFAPAFFQQRMIEILYSNLGPYHSVRYPPRG